MEEGTAGRSGFLGSADRLVVRLRRSTKGQGGRSCNGGTSAARSSGGSRAALREELKESASGLLDGTTPLVARLRSKLGGQDGLSFAGGEESRRRSELT